MGCVSSSPSDADSLGPAAKPHGSTGEGAVGVSSVVASVTAASKPPPPVQPEAGSSSKAEDTLPRTDRQLAHGSIPNEGMKHPGPLPSTIPNQSQPTAPEGAAAVPAAAAANASKARQEAPVDATAVTLAIHTAAAATVGSPFATSAAAATPAATPATSTTSLPAEFPHAEAASQDSLHRMAPSTLATSGRTPSGVRRDRSNLSRKNDDGEESDWDQYSTENMHPDQERDAEEKQPGMPSAAAVPKETPEQAFIRETSILRIDKVKGCVFVNQYLVVKFLGRGACGKVFLCLNTHDLCLYAMKAVRKVDLGTPPVVASGKTPRNPMDDLKREVMIMKGMKHTNIVTLSEVIDDPAGSKLMLVMEYMDRGPVLTREALERHERLPEAIARHYFRDMVKALDYLHTHKIVHGDLKPENVLLAASGDVKLSDFGCSKVFATGNEYMDRCNGTPAFLAPEMMKPNTRYRGRPTDVYALGACLYTLLFGRIPFSAPSLYKLFEVVQKEPVNYPDDVPISMPLRHMLERMLVKNPKERITLPELMKHPWVSLDGQFPIKSLRQLKQGETNDNHDKLTNGITFDQCNPRPTGLPALAHLSTHERTFGRGEIIMKQGEIGMFALYIVSGTADVLVKWTPPKTGKALGPANGGAGVGGGATNSFSQDEFMDESEIMSPITDEDSRENRIKLLHASVKAQDFIQNLQEAAAGSGLCSNDLLVAQRGPGELLGDMALFRKNKSRCATVRCATDLCVRVILKDQLYKYMMDNTVPKLQIRESILSKESEITMVDSLVKLANSYPVIAASLEPTMWEYENMPP